MADQSIPLKISIAPFPEGFQGDMDETFQQACILMDATVEGSFLTGLVLPPGSTLPTSDVGPIAMGSTWYFWDPITNQYLPQSLTTRTAINICKNGCYQIQQTGVAIALGAGTTKIFDMAMTKMTTIGVLSLALDVGPLAGADYDTCPAAVKYTVGTTVPTLAATDLYAHEHVVEGSDLNAVQGEILSLSFLCWVTQPGTYSVYLTNGVRDSSYCATFAMNAAQTWTRIKIQSIPPMPTGNWNYGEGGTGMYIGVVMAIGSQYKTANLNQWNSGFFGGAATNTNMVTVTNNQMKITAMRLEASPQSSYAVINPIEDDFHDCIRYYWTSFNYRSTSAGTPVQGVSHASGGWLFDFLFPRRMCNTPVVTPYSLLNQAGGNITNITANQDIAVAHLNATQKGIYMTGTVARIQPTGNTLDDFPAITGLSSVSGLVAGMLINGPGIYANGTVISSIGGTATKGQRIVGRPIGGYPVIMGVTTTGLVAGMSVSGYGVSANISSLGGSSSIVLTGMLTSASPYVTGLASTDGLVAGMTVTGSGIPASTTIISISSPTTVQLNNNATATGASLLTIAGAFDANRTLIMSANCGATTETMLTISETVSAASGVVLSRPVAGTNTGGTYTADTLLKSDVLGAYVIADARLS